MHEAKTRYRRIKRNMKNVGKGKIKQNKIYTISAHNPTPPPVQILTWWGSDASTSEYIKMYVDPFAFNIHSFFFMGLFKYPIGINFWKAL